MLFWGKIWSQQVRGHFLKSLLEVALAMLAVPVLGHEEVVPNLVVHVLSLKKWQLPGLPSKESHGRHALHCFAASKWAVMFRCVAQGDMFCRFCW